MQYGQIKLWEDQKGYGFIITNDGDEIFVHISDLDVSLKPNEIKEGLFVKFDIQNDLKGDKAVRVRKA